MFTNAEASACARLVELALAEDLAGVGDCTSQALIPQEDVGQANLVARVVGVLAGLPAAALVAHAVEGQLTLETCCCDGSVVHPGQVLAVLAGPMRAILKAERTMLNFLQNLSGIATLTRRFVDAVAGLPCAILDTRKTLPGWRLLAKYAVRQGGGCNHRLGLFDGILIKDNHLAALGGGPDAVTRAVQAVRTRYGSSLPVEVEVETLEQLDRALACGPDMVLLDNMSVDELAEAVNRRNRVALAVLLEASGGITLANVRAIAETGVDRISVGALTHSAPVLDIALDYRTE
jgi:nicotinate-nucleotide pyrophosphorylase (carboxylating)